jgi:hypothetical protein
MQQPTSKAEIIARTRAAEEAWDAAWIGVTDEEMLLPGAVGDWTLKDVLAHVAADDRWFAGQLEALVRGETPTALACYGDETPPAADVDMTTTDGRNEWHYHRNRDLPLDEARRRAAEARARRDAALEALPPAEFEALYTIADLGHVAHLRRAREGEQAWPLHLAIGGNGWHHYDDHTRDVLAARERFRAGAETPG